MFWPEVRFGIGSFGESVVVVERGGLKALVCAMALRRG
jgi:hypothetical protein